MNFWEKITGNDMKKEYQAFQSRAQKLPADHQAAFEQIQLSLWPASDFTGRNLLPIMDGTLSLLEDAAATGMSATDVLGEDIRGFCTSLAGEEGAATYRDKWRKHLNDTVAKKLGQLGGKK